jgi:hypothetical protein
MPTTEQRLTAICDDLLRAVSEHNRLWPSQTARVSKLTDRILDIRNLLSPPKNKQQPQTTSQP